jgi:tetratricopeptide (TPR) repeat protein
MLKKINQAFDYGDNLKGLTLLRDFVKNNKNDQEQSYRLAVIEEQIGSPELALKSYNHCLKVAGNNVLIYLYAGYFFWQQGLHQKALAIWSLGNDLDDRLTRFHWSEQMDDQTRMRSYEADVALRKHFTKLHKQSVFESHNSSLIYNAIWPQTCLQAFDYQNKRQKPHLFYIPNLRAQTIFDTSGVEWCKNVENDYKEVKKEFEDLISLIEEQGEPYLDQSYKDVGFNKLAGSKKWQALHLYKNGVVNTNLLAKLPKVQKLLTKIPLYKLNENPFEVFFSLLKAGQHITPHYGLSNHSLTVHLPFIVPDSGYLRVGEDKVNWHEGKLIVFDDSFDHEAHNTSDKDRVVLIFSVWHPDLTKSEQGDIKATFIAREKWLAKRNDYLP